MIMGCRLVKRVFRDDTCIGYYMTDGVRVELININDVYSYIQNGLIENVALKFVNGKPVIYGTNGFRIEDLPVEKLQKEKQGGQKGTILHILSVNRDASGNVVGFKVTDGMKQADVSINLAVGYLNRGILDKDSSEKLSTFLKGIEGQEKVDLVKVYNEYDIRDTARAYIEVLDALETGDKSEKNSVVDRVKTLENKAASGGVSEQLFREELSKFKGDLINRTADKTSIYIKNSRNSLAAQITKLVDRIRGLKKEHVSLIVSDISSLNALVNELGSIKDFNTFRNKYKDANKVYIDLNRKANDLLNKQQLEESELNKKFNEINTEISKISDADELKSEKVKLLYEPWCLNNRPFLNSGKYLENCYLTDKETGKMKLSLAHVSVNETFSQATGKRTGFKVSFNGKEYIYKQVLNNMNLMAAFIKVAEDNNLLASSDVNIRVKSRGETHNIRLGVE